MKLYRSKTVKNFLNIFFHENIFEKKEDILNKLPFILNDIFFFEIRIRNNEDIFEFSFYNENSELTILYMTITTSATL